MKTKSSITDLKASCDQFLNALRMAVSNANSRVEDAQAQRNEVDELVATVQADSGELLEEIRGIAPTRRKPAKKTRGKLAKRAAAKASRRKIEKTPKGGHNGKEVVSLEGQKIEMTEGAAWVLKKFLEKPDITLSETALLNGHSKGMLVQRLVSIRKILKDRYGAKGPKALVTHRGKGHSLDLSLAH